MRYKFLTHVILQILNDKINFEIPETGHFKNKTAYFLIPGTKDYGVLCIQHNRTAPMDERCLTISALRKETDRSISIFAVSGKNEDIKRYLTDKKAKEEVLEQADKFKKVIDENKET